jgi:pilus assembly protein Flp/PilA
MKLLRKFLGDESGPTAVEYAVMLAMIIVTCLGAIGFFGSEAGGSIRNTSDRIDQVVNG